MELSSHSHKRLNILTGEWVLVSPHRMKRPWQGKEEQSIPKPAIVFDENCYLCPGNTRANGKRNPNYTSTYVFENDFSALAAESDSKTNIGLLKSKEEQGVCKVVCYSSNHSKTMADLSLKEIKKVIDVWQQEFSDLSAIDFINYIQIFENKGEIMGCSNPHPHGQIWAQSSIPNEVAKKIENQKTHYLKNGNHLVECYIQQELELKERIVYQNDDFVVLVPFWAVWPYETMILPKRRSSNITFVSKSEKASFAEALKKITVTYDKLFDCSFPYSAGFHQLPTKNEDADFFHWHFSFYPPLLRSANVKKFMVGYEMFGMPQRDITAEVAAKQLKSLIS